jgi:hypothetical protein
MGVSLGIHYLLAFTDDSLHRLAGLALRIHTHLVKNTLQARHMPFGLSQMLLKGLLQFRRRCAIDHFGKSFHNTLFSII